MSAKPFRAKIDEIRSKIQELELEIKMINDSCHHVNTEHEYHANCGNYDPHSDSYWIDVYCMDCYWSKTNIDSRDPLYHFYGMHGIDRAKKR